jgi:hypothetical protein
VRPELEPADIQASIAYAHAVFANDGIEAVKVPLGHSERTPC